MDQQWPPADGALFFLFSLLCPISRRRQWPSIKGHRREAAETRCSCGWKHISHDVCDMIYTAHYHKSTLKHLSQNQIRKSVTDPYMEHHKALRPCWIQEEAIYEQASSSKPPPTPPSPSDSQPRAQTLVYTWWVCTDWAPLPRLSATLRRSVTGSHMLTHTSPRIPDPRNPPTPRQSSVRSGQIPFLQNSDTSAADTSQTPQRWCGLAPSPDVLALQPSFNTTNNWKGWEMGVHNQRCSAGPEFEEITELPRIYTNQYWSVVWGPEKDNYPLTGVKSICDK